MPGLRAPARLCRAERGRSRSSVCVFGGLGRDASFRGGRARARPGRFRRQTPLARSRDGPLVFVITLSVCVISLATGAPAAGT